MPRLVLLVLLIASMPPALISCSKEQATNGGDAARGEGFEISKSYGSGAVKFTLEVSAKSISTADSLVCRMTMDLAEGYEAEFPDVAFPDDVPGTVLTRFDEHEKKEGDRRLQIREYEIEPEFEGTIKFPTMEVYYRKAAEVKEDRLEIEPVEVAVTATELGGDAIAFRPARGLIETDRIDAMQRRIWPKVLGAVAIAAALVVAVVWWARRPKVEPPPPPAHEIALKRLRELERSDLIGRRKVEPFFVAVTEIVRDYIEGAFGLRAPEQTTEEFLAGLATASEVARHREVLQPFLTAADEVKFARFDADETAMRRAFETAERFVRQTSRTEGSER
jgi:hypothetical protein